MPTNYFKHLWNTSINLHRIHQCDDLNFYYRKFLDKLSEQYLKLLLPLLFLVYLCPLFLCRVIFFKSVVDLRTSLLFCLTCVGLILCLLTRLRIKWRRAWISIRFLLILLLISPVGLTSHTEQSHLLLPAISILLTYSLLTFTLIQSFLISLTISLLHLVLLIFQRPTIGWTYRELSSTISYHLIIQIFGLYFYVTIIEQIRQHFYAYKTTLHEKNKANVDCKKLRTIMGYCRRSNNLAQPLLNIR